MTARTLRRAGTVLATVTLALVASAIPARAHAKLSPFPTDCAGSQIGHHDLAGGNLSVFEFYSSINGGTNCSWVQKNIHRGTAEPLNIIIFRCVAGNWSGQPDCPWGAVDSDPGDWKYYAGPVRVSSAANRCIWTIVEYRSASYSISPHHCG